MIENIRIENFKSLKEVDIKLGSLNIFIGTNASGKSNFFDALRVIQGIGYGFTFDEILNGKPKSASSIVWESIRGGSAKAVFEGSESTEVRFNLDVNIGGEKEAKQIKYSIAFSPRRGKNKEESFEFNGNRIYDSQPIQRLTTDPVFEVRYYQGKRGTQPHHKFEPSRPVLSQFAKGSAGKWSKAHAESAADFQVHIANMQRLDPSPSILREYSQAHQIQRMGERGENFAALVAAICKNEKLKDAYLTWLRHLRPAEVNDVGTISGALGEPLFTLKEGGNDFPAPVLSDGTLRFAAITAAFFQPDMPDILTIEEIENGVHASRLRLMVELLRNRSKDGNTQVMVTTHSPIVLAWLQESEYATTFFCKRDEVTGESKICPLTEIPHFLDVVKKQPIGDLFAEGWLEAAI